MRRTSQHIPGLLRIQSRSALLAYLKNISSRHCTRDKIQLTLYNTGAACWSYCAVRPGNRWKGGEKGAFLKLIRIWPWVYGGFKNGKRLALGCCYWWAPVVPRTVFSPVIGFIYLSLRVYGLPCLLPVSFQSEEASTITLLSCPNPCLNIDELGLLHYLPHKMQELISICTGLGNAF